MSGGRRWLPVAAIAAVTASGCVQYGVIDDGTSVSFGGSSGGALHHGVCLPVQGDGWRIPHRWAARGLHYGTDELVTLIVRAARRVTRESPGEPLVVGDLSPRAGGDSAWHRSHQSGRDADLIFFAVDAGGRPVRVDTMDRYLADGSLAPRTLRAGEQAPPLRFFDVTRNWLLVRALVEDPDIDIQYLFIFDPLRQKLLDHAAAIGEPPAVIARAGALLHQPSDSLPHDDHLHVRIFCPPSDRALGCRDRGILRWKKKGYKYEAMIPPRPAAEEPAEPVALVRGALAAVGASLHGVGGLWLLPPPPPAI
jgi:penicillin-insensitive murein endopeptidase